MFCLLAEKGRQQVKQRTKTPAPLIFPKAIRKVPILEDPGSVKQEAGGGKRFQIEVQCGLGDDDRGAGLFAAEIDWHRSLEGARQAHRDFTSRARLIPDSQQGSRPIRIISEGGDQILFSTHSSLLVDVGYFDEIIRLESRVEKLEGRKVTQSQAWQLPMAKMINDLETRNPKLKGKVTPDSMRDLYSHAYNPRRNEGFFASKIILVEGLTEEYSLPIYADAIEGCSFDPQNISVVECGGKGAMDRLFRIFNELHIPCYLLLDYDSGNTDKKIIEKSKELLVLAGEASDEPKALFVADGVACFQKKWETDLRGELPDVDVLTAEARKLLGLSDDTGKPLIARYIARKLTSQTPPVVPASLKAIIQKGVAVTWKKSCLASPT